ncbi:MAG TPA: DUF418 domain-containing protein [Gemmatimonadales bacterium]|nr:DUF418 domain-containing protein [Gemmatimonadales bacterium]
MRSFDILRGFALLGMILVHVHQNLERPGTSLEVALSRLWLARHRWGPLEWLWRWFTYGARQPLQISLA